MSYNIVLINALQREIKRRQARNRHIFRLISLFLPPLPEQKSSQCREGVSLTDNLWRRYGIFSQILQIIFFGGEGYDFTQISQISQIFLSHRLFQRRWIKRVIISLSETVRILEREFGFTTTHYRSMLGKLRENF